MDQRMPMFAGGAVGALVFFAVLLGRNWDSVSRVQEMTGVKGLVVVFAGAIMVAALTGALTLAVHPANFFGAVVFGLVPPALLIVIGVPRFGLPTIDRSVTLEESLGDKTMPFAVWTGLSPIATFTDLQTDRALTDFRNRSNVVLERARTEERAAVTKQAREAAADAAQKAEAALNAAVKAEQDKAAAERANAATALEAAVAAAKAAMQAELDDARQRQREATAQTAKFAGEIQHLKEQLASAGSAQTTVQALQDEIAALRAGAADAEARATAAETRFGDLDRLAGWYLTDAPNSSARLINVLTDKLRARDPKDRAAACRLLVRCGKEAVSHLERALNDSDPSVAQAALEALDTLGQ